MKQSSDLSPTDLEIALQVEYLASSSYSLRFMDNYLPSFWFSCLLIISLYTTK